MHSRVWMGCCTVLVLASAACGDSSGTTETSASGTQGSTGATVASATEAPSTMTGTGDTPTGSASDSVGMTTTTNDPTMTGSPTSSTTVDPTATATTNEPSTTTGGTTSGVLPDTTTGSTGEPGSTSTGMAGSSSTGEPPPCEPGDGMGMGMVEKSFIWIASYNLQDISKVDTLTMTELARYRTGPGQENPSRTAVSADGRWVAGAAGNLIFVWDLEKRAQSDAVPVELVGHTDEVMHLAFSVGGDWLVSAGLRGAVHSWRMSATGPELDPKHTVERPPTVLALAVSREHVAVGTGGGDETRGEVFVWPLGELGKRDEDAVWDHAKAVQRLAFDATGEYLASGSGDGGVKFGKLGDEGFGDVRQYSHGLAVSALAFAALAGRGVMLASGSDDGEVLSFTRADQRDVPQRTVVKRKGRITGLAFGSDPGLLFVAGDEGAALLQMEGDAKRQILLSGHKGSIAATYADVVGRVVVTVGADRTVRVWPLEVSALQHLVCAHVGRNLRPEELPAGFQPTAESQCPAR